MTIFRTRALLGAFGVGAVIGCLLAPPAAHADGGQDAEFLQLITSHGMTFGDADVALQEGRAVCDTLGDGYTDAAVIGAVQQVMPITYAQAVYVVAASIASFCPQFAPARRTFAVAAI